MTTPHALQVDMDQLAAIASERIIERGIQYFRQNRVFELSCSDGQLAARVEGSVPDDPYAVSVRSDEDARRMVRAVAGA